MFWRSRTDASPQLTLASAAKVGRWLQASLSQYLFAFDRHGLVEYEYSKHASRSGQPGVGDLFFRQVLARSRVRYFDIGVTIDEIDMLVPASLRDFDEDDRKWIALYFEAHAEDIVNASDSDYAERRDDLNSEGISVLELCEDEIVVKNVKSARK